MSGAYGFNSGYGQQQSYPPPHDGVNPSYTTRPYEMPPLGSGAPKNKNTNPNVAVDVREVSRTPSPTPSEIHALNAKNGPRAFIRAIINYKAWLKVKNIPYMIAFAVAVTLIVLLAVYNQNIILFIQPTADKVKDLTAGWLIFVAILFVISFPPLFGHEIVAPIVGLIYGLLPGFGIVCLGTFLGEVGNYYAFKYCCRARGEKLERENIRYGALAKVIREGGLKVAIIARLSAIPPHFTTAVFSTCGLNVFIFIIAVIVALPKQFVTVYVGVVLGESADGTETTKDKRISRIVLVATIVITIVAFMYINRKIKAATPAIVYARRKRRQAKLESGGMSYASSGSGSGSGSGHGRGNTFNPDVSESELPLTAGGSHQQWDSEGNAVGYTDPSANVYDSSFASPGVRAPVPRRTGGTSASVDSLAWDTPQQQQQHQQQQRSAGFRSPPPGSASAGQRVYSPPAGAPPGSAGMGIASAGMRSPPPGSGGARAFSPPTGAPPSYRGAF